jgi:N-methylhydantoinase A
LAGGSVPIDREAGERAIREQIAEPLGLDVVEAALGIVRVANATMMRALRAVSVEKGARPSEFTLVAFGGAGPVHAAQLAADVGVSTVYIPPFPGIFSAVGLLLAEFRHDTVTSFVAPLDGLDPDELWAAFGELRAELAGVLASEGIDAADAVFEPAADLHYHGHDESLTLPVTDADLGRLRERFTRTHVETFGHTKNLPVDVARLHLRATAPTGDTRSLSDLVARDVPGAAAGGEPRRVHFAGRADALETPVTTRAALAAGALPGPLLLDEPDTTIVVPPGWTAALDARHNVVLSREGGVA